MLCECVNIKTKTNLQQHKADHCICLSHCKQYCCNVRKQPTQYTEIFISNKNGEFQWKNVDIFLIFAQNKDCGYMLEFPRRGGSNEYPQSMFWSKNRPQFFLYKSGV